MLYLCCLALQSFQAGRQAGSDIVYVRKQLYSSAQFEHFTHELSFVVKPGSFGKEIKTKRLIPVVIQAQIPLFLNVPHWVT